ncbi:hypothetical protein BKA69DRAFT_593073 [Paraphysoderma sedebokerense]|nr:hypothetical protein BKA69DRAFT_593073 [Paraphysoderma sedebokerense]
MRWSWLLSLCLLLHLTVFATLSSPGYISTPWYLKNRISIPTFQNETTLIDATTNSTHIFVLDSDFQLHLFSGSDNQNNNSLAHVTSYNLSYPIGAYVCCLDWSASRNVTASALSYNPYNGYLYLAKYVLLDRIRLKLYRFRAEDVANITFFDYDYRDLAINYFQTNYANPRVTFHFDETSLFATIYNEPTEIVIMHMLSAFQRSRKPRMNTPCSTLLSFSRTPLRRHSMLLVSIPK